LISGTKSHIEIIDSARLGTGDYDFYSIELIKEEATVFEIKSKIDGKTYEAKRLQYQIGNQLNTRITEAAAEREISSLRALNHPMIKGIVDIVKDYHSFPYIIMEKCN
jgi:serine/threonine protein kinase